MQTNAVTGRQFVKMTKTEKARLSLTRWCTFFFIHMIILEALFAAAILRTPNADSVLLFMSMLFSGAMALYSGAMMMTAFGNHIVYRIKGE